jgi:Tol biopolymer transport system component
VIVALAVPGSAGAATPGKIAFVSNRDGHNEIYVMNADGSGQTRITTTANNVDNRDPAWSPDAKQIAFFSNRDNPGADMELWIMNADGSSPRQLTANTVDDFSVDWAPDGKKLVFTSSASAGGNLSLINVDGSGLTPLISATPGQPYFGAHFSPDGTQIVFTDGTGTLDPLRLISPAGALGAILTPGMDGFSPDFTADGTRIIFESEVDGDEDIYSIKPDGADLRNISNTPSVGGNTDDDRSPSPSRDGLNRIAFSSFRGGDQELYLMNADGSGQIQLTNTNGTNRGPDWQPTAVCQGKVATIVGTSASETLTGGPSADIISGQGGKDQISGLDGNDVICGDAGKDTLRGGKGKDVLNGGKANDKLNGGKGKDTCIGGKGKKDTGKSCEKEKGIP